MIELDSSRFIGKGWHRECYIHPDNDKLCVKVVVSGNLDESKREQKYYKFLQKRRARWEILPEFHGLIETNMGSGAVFDLIRDFDGEVSKTLEYYLLLDDLTEAENAGISTAIDVFKRELLQQTIITMGILPKNIMYKKTAANEGALVVIDNIGNSDFIPICNYINYLAKKKITRKLLRFHHAILKMSHHNKALHQKILR